MNVFDCKCGYRSIVGKKKVYGPIFVDRTRVDASAARMMTTEEFHEGYADCQFRMSRTGSQPENLH